MSFDFNIYLTFETAIRLTEIFMGFAFAQQSLEYVKVRELGRSLFVIRFGLAILLIIGFQTTWVLVLLVIIGMIMLNRFHGPYNGGSDRMGLLVLFCLCSSHLAPTQYWKEVAFGYLALQTTLSYFISGWVKVINPEWRTGQALCDVFKFSAYPVCESLRNFANKPRLLFFMGWSVILFELVFPLSLFSGVGLIVALTIAATFHFTNACIFGLNRFFLIWISAYPSIFWLQSRLLESA